MKKLKAIIFDVDGTMVNSERYGHLPACNDAMKQIGLNINWNWDDFKYLIKNIPGSVNRLKNELNNAGYSESEIDEYAAKFEPLKKQIYIENYLPKLKIRSGVKKILSEAVKQKISISIISTSFEEQIEALLKSKFSQFEKHFEIIYGKESGKKTYNNGFLHKKFLSVTGFSADEVLMIEDSTEGLQASLEAEIPTAIIYNDYTFGEDFTNAKLVASSLKVFSLEDLEYLCLK
jgi:phosphoglycolate phosphatase-like HAD superfamily hydrolase